MKKLLELLKRVRSIIMSIFGFDEDKNKVDLTDDTGWVTLLSAGTHTDSNGNTVTVSTPIQYRRLNGIVYIRGVVIAFAPTNVSGRYQEFKIGTLPSNCKSPTSIRSVVSIDNVDTSKVFLLDVNGTTVSLHLRWGDAGAEATEYNANVGFCTSYPVI